MINFSFSFFPLAPGQFPVSSSIFDFCLLSKSHAKTKTYRLSMILNQNMFTHVVFLLLLCTEWTNATNRFSVSGSGCTTSGSCFQSSNYPDNYGTYETCRITVESIESGETLSSTAFSTWPEGNYGKLSIGSTQYFGYTGPSNVAVNVGDEFIWSAATKTASGFHICLLATCTKTNGL